MTQVWDPKGNEIDYAYTLPSEENGPRKLLNSVTTADGAQTLYTYVDLRPLTYAFSHTYPSSVGTHYGDPTSQTRADGTLAAATKTLEYGNVYRIMSAVTDEDSHRTVTTVDSLGGRTDEQTSDADHKGRLPLAARDGAEAYDGGMPGELRSVEPATGLTWLGACASIRALFAGEWIGGLMSQIVAEALSKTYRIQERTAGLTGWWKRKTRTVHALRDISFRIERGEMVGYIGPNGAGKSTTVKILSGILVPDSGVCEVDGRVPWKDRIAHVSRIGVVFGQRTQLWWDLPIVESFDLLRDMYRVPGADYRPWRDTLVERLDIGSFLHQPVRQLSLGQRMRADLAAAMLHRPALLFLDEPTIGLDAISKLAVREFLRELNRQEGVTVILTTHDLDDIEALCRRVMVIGDGRILSDGSLAQLRGAVRDERILTVDLRHADAVFDEAPARVVQREGKRVVLRFVPEEITSTELIRRITARHEVEDLFLELLPIEEIVSLLYQQHQARSA